METRTTAAQELWELLDRVHSMMISLIADELRLNGRQSRQRLELLKVVSDLGPTAIPARLAETMVRAPHTVSALVDRMEDDGMLRKLKDMPARNQVRLELTEQGQAMLLKSEQQMDVVERVFSSIPAGVFKGQLDRIAGKANLLYKTSRRKA